MTYPNKPWLHVLEWNDITRVNDEGNQNDTRVFSCFHSNTSSISEYFNQTTESYIGQENAHIEYEKLQAKNKYNIKLVSKYIQQKQSFVNQP